MKTNSQIITLIVYLQISAGESFILFHEGIDSNSRRQENHLVEKVREAKLDNLELKSGLLVKTIKSSPEILVRTWKTMFNKKMIQ